MPMVYSHGGHSFGNRPDDYVLQDGEVVLPEGASAEKIVEHFPNFLKDKLDDYAKAVRYAKEVGGLIVGGMQIATDDRSKQMIIGARIAADANPSFTTPWVTASGDIVAVDAPTMIAISNAVLAHVGSCFAAYAAAKTQIDAGQATTTAAIDALFA